MSFSKNSTPKRQFLKLSEVFQRKDLGLFFLLGMGSAIPFFNLTQVWIIACKQAGSSNTWVSLAVFWGSFPYVLKFLYGPLLDKFSPLWGTGLRGWGITVQSLLCVSLILMGLAPPEQHPWISLVMVMFISFCAALNDLIAETLRLDLMSKGDEVASAAAASVGFRVGMFLVSSGGVWLLAKGGWMITQLSMAAMTACSGWAFIVAEEPSKPPLPKGTQTWAIWRNFFRYDQGFFIVFVIFFLKYASTALSHGVVLCLTDRGVDGYALASLRAWGVASLFLGTALAGFLWGRAALYRVIWVASLAITLVCILFSGSWRYDQGILYALIAAENLAHALISLASMTYIAYKAQGPSTATLLAILASASSICRVITTALSGWLSDMLGWSYFFIFTGCISCGIFAILYFFPAHFQRYGKSNVI